MSRSSDRRSPLERGSPETKPRSCGNQPAHESLFNRRLRVLSPAVRTSEPVHSVAAVTKNCVRTLESEHESRLLKKSVTLSDKARVVAFMDKNMPDEAAGRARAATVTPQLRENCGLAVQGIQPRRSCE